MPSPSAAAPAIRLGLLENWQQFSLLVLINAFVGGMVGLERTIVPLLAEQEFGLASRTIALSFIVSFGVVKALANLFAGRFSDRIGRKQILIAGWLFGLPVPVIIMLAPSWDWIVSRQCAPRDQPGALLVNDDHHEDRPRRPGTAGSGDGAQ